MTNPDPHPDATERDNLLDQILDPYTHPVMAALHGQLYTPRPRHVRMVIICGVVGSALAFADDHIHFTLNVYQRPQRGVHRRHIRCRVALLDESCPTLARGDFLELIGIAYKAQNATEVLYIRQIVSGEPTPLEEFIEILGKLLGVQLPRSPLVDNEG
jgi:hypothetical protein